MKPKSERATDINKKLAELFISIAHVRREQIDVVSKLPTLAEGFMYRQRQGALVEVDYVPTKIEFACGGVFVVDTSANKKYPNYTILDRSGLSLGSAEFKKITPAKKLAKSLGPRIDEFFDRGMAGNAHAIQAILRLCRLHVKKDRMRSR